MSVKEQFSEQLWAETDDYDEVRPYIDNPLYYVLPQYKFNGERDGYFVGLK